MSGRTAAERYKRLIVSCLERPLGELVGCAETTLVLARAELGEMHARFVALARLVDDHNDALRLEKADGGSITQPDADLSSVYANNYEQWRSWMESHIAFIHFDIRGAWDGEATEMFEEIDLLAARLDSLTFLLERYQTYFPNQII